MMYLITLIAVLIALAIGLIAGRKLNESRCAAAVAAHRSDVNQLNGDNWLLRHKLATQETKHKAALARMKQLKDSLAREVDTLKKSKPPYVQAQVQKMAYHLAATGEYPYFSYCPENGLSFYKTEQEAVDAGSNEIRQHIDDGWSENVDQVFVGRVLHHTKQCDVTYREGSVDEDGYDEAGTYWDEDWPYMCDYKLFAVEPDHSIISKLEKSMDDYETAMHRVAQLENETDRLIEHSAALGIGLRDGDNDAATESWRYLPDHLQARINEVAERMDAESVPI